MKTPRDDLHVLTGSYALDALPDLERKRFERHLARCASCQAEVRGLTEAAARLAMAKAVQPPPEMERRVLAATYQTRQLPPASARPGRPRVPRWVAAVAAAAVAAAVGLGIAQAVTHPRPGQASSAAITRVVTAPDARTRTMHTTAGGTVTVVVSFRQRRAVVTTTGMGPLPASRVYQVWVMSRTGARSAGLVPHGKRASRLLASGVVPGDRIGITVEPAGGTPRPTTTPIMVMPLPA